MENEYNITENLDKFYFHDELSGIYDYYQILIQLFGESKLKNIEWIHLEFNDMRDIYLNKVVLSMLESEYIHKTLSWLTFAWLNSCDKNWRFPAWNERQFSLGNNDDENENKQNNT